MGFDRSALLTEVSARPRSRIVSNDLRRSGPRRTLRAAFFRCCRIAPITAGTGLPIVRSNRPWLIEPCTAGTRFLTASPVCLLNIEWAAIPAHALSAGYRDLIGTSIRRAAGIRIGNCRHASSTDQIRGCGS